VTNLKKKLTKNLKENITDPNPKAQNPKKLANLKPKAPNKTLFF
jgi:hypothetical protein